MKFKKCSIELIWTHWIFFFCSPLLRSMFKNVLVYAVASIQSHISDGCVMNAITWQESKWIFSHFRPLSADKWWNLIIGLSIKTAFSKSTQNLLKNVHVVAINFQDSQRSLYNKQKKHSEILRTYISFIQWNRFAVK